MVEFYSPGKKYPGPQAIFMPHPAIPTQTLLERFLTEAPGLKQKVPMAGIFHKDFRHIRSTAAEALQRLTQTPNMPWRLSHAQHLLLGDTAFSFESRERVSQSPKTFSMPLVRFGDNDFLTTCPTDHRMVIRGKSCSHSAVQVLFNGINVSSGRRDQRFDDLRGDVVSDKIGRAHV